MHVFELTRALIDIESISGNEEKVGQCVFDHLSGWPRHGGNVEKMEVEPRRFNVLAVFGEAPVVTLHAPRYRASVFASSEDDESILRARACDVKDIIAAMIWRRSNWTRVRGFGLLFVVGEERNSARAYHREEPARVEDI
ncbi:MAG: hypothetical protein HS123_15995 [Solibacteraceae bacterium]|nr:hypothetical protein [Solibacteraceae bacterium]